MASQPSNQNFLFVNKDLSSHKLSQSARKEKHRILSHVRSNNAASKQPWKQYSTVFDVGEDSDVKTSNRPVASSDAVPPMLVQDAIHDNHHDAQPRTGAPWLKTLRHNESVYTYLSNMRPFFSGSDSSHRTMVDGIDVTTGLHRTEDSVEEHSLQASFSTKPLEPPSALESRSSSIHHGEILERLKACVEDDLLLYSSIAHGSSSLAWKNGHVGDNRSRFWIGRTLQGLRQRLERPLAIPDTGVVLSVFTLALAALSDAIPRMWSNNPYEIDVSQFETCRTHLRAMLTLVERAGGWHKFNSHALEGMLLVDKYTALYGLSSPLIPLSFDPRDEQLEFPGSKVPAQDAIPNIATGFLDLEIDHDLQKILQSVGGFYHTAAGIWKIEVKLTPQQENLIYRRFQAIHYQLLLLKTTDSSSELVRLATLVVLCNITLYTAGLVFTRVMSCHLHEKMKKVLSRGGENIDPRIWYWCLCTGATTRLVASDKSWFVNQFLEQMAGTESESTLAAIRRSMTKYLYIPWLQDTELEAVLKRQRVTVTEQERVEK